MVAVPARLVVHATAFLRGTGNVYATCWLAIAGLGLEGLDTHDGGATEFIKPGEERFFLAAGAFLPSFDTRLRVDNKELGIGDEVDLEKDLGLNEEETVFWGSGYWRFASCHRLSLSYFQFKRDASAIAQQDIEIDDEIFPVGATLASEFKIQVVPIAYSYSLVKRSKLEFGGSLGSIGFRSI